MYPSKPTEIKPSRQLSEEGIKALLRRLNENDSSLSVLEFPSNTITKISLLKQLVEALFLAIISAKGIKETMYSEELVSSVVTLDDLYKK